MPVGYKFGEINATVEVIVEFGGRHTYPIKFIPTDAERPFAEWLLQKIRQESERASRAAQDAPYNQPDLFRW